MQPWKVRPAKQEDIPFILNSWLKRYRDAISVRLVTDRVYYEKQHQVIRAILGKVGLGIFVACSQEDEDQIYGYVVGETLSDKWLIIHWVYVKGPFRRFGIAKDLMKRVLGGFEEIHYSHKTHLIEFLDKEKKWKYNPYYVWSLL